MYYKVWVSETRQSGGGAQGPGDGRSAGDDRHRRKERVLHTRISEQLAEDVRRLAEELRVPVSNVVRTVLEEAVGAVESVSDNVGELIEDVVEEAGRAREEMLRRRARRRTHRAPAPPGPVDAAPEPGEGPAPRPDAEPIGWLPLVLARRRECGDCGAALARGSRAYVVATAEGLGSDSLCRDCVDGRV